MAQGLQHIPLGRSIPQQWDAAWFAKFIREVLALADVRNAIEGPGISISGQPGDVATISASADIQNLLLQSYVTASASVFLPNERVLDGENGVISITDNGPGSLITVGIFDGGIPYSKLNEIDELSVLGNPTPTFGAITPINGTAQHQVLSVQLNGSDLEVRFDTITHQSVSDFDEAAQDAVGGILVDSDTIDFTYADATPSITGSVKTQMSITSDSSGLKLSGDTSTPGNSKYYGTDTSGVAGFWALPSSGGGGGSGGTGTTVPIMSGYGCNYLRLRYTMGTSAVQENADGPSWSATASSNTLVAAASGSATPILNSAHRQLLSSAAATGVVTFYTNNLATGARVTATYANAAGFTANFIFGITAVNAAGDTRLWVGLQNGTGSPANSDPSGLTNVLALAADAADSNIQFMWNDGSGTATKSSLGITKASLVGKMLSLNISAPRGGGNVAFSLYVVDDNATYTATASSNLPAIDAVLIPRMMINDTNNAEQTGLRVVDVACAWSYGNIP